MIKVINIRKSMLFLLVAVSAGITQAKTIEITHTINDLQRAMIIKGDICVQGIVTQALTKGVFYIESIVDDRDTKIATSEGLRVYVRADKRDEVTAKEFKIKDVVKVCGRHSEFQNTSFISVIKYGVRVGPDNEGVTLSLNRYEPVTSLSYDRLEKLAGVPNLVTNVLSCESLEDERWLEAYENMVVSLTGVTVVKGGDADIAKDFRFYVTSDNSSCPIQITPKGKLALERGSTLKPFRVLITEGPFSHEAIPVDDIAVDLKTVKVAKDYSIPEGFERLVSYNVKNLEPISREVGFKNCMASDVDVSATPEVVASLERANSRLKPGARPKTTKSEYCSVVKSQVGKDKAKKIAEHIVSKLAKPAVIALQEIQDNDGAVISDDLSATISLDYLTSEVNALSAVDGGIKYTSILNGKNQDELNPETSGEYGGAPGSNIRNAFLFREDFLENATNMSISKVTSSFQYDGQDSVRCDLSVSEIFERARAPITFKFTLNGQSYALINVHQSSNFGGRTQAKIDKRFCQNEVLAQYAEALKAEEKSIKVILAGDFNDGPLSTAFTPLNNFRPYPLAKNTYTHMFNGHGEQLDYFFSTGFKQKEATVGVAEINAQYTNGASDHNPIFFDFPSSK